MPSLHLLKMFVGLPDLEGLVRFQRRKLEDAAAEGRPRELTHVTLRAPKRGAELLAGGSIYWVMSGAIMARQRLAALRPVLVEGVQHCQVVFGPDLVPVVPRPHRAFQGWRYLDAKDAPPDLAAGDFAAGDLAAGDRAALPPALAVDLARLGLL